MDRGRIHNRTTNKTKGRGSTPRRSLHRQRRLSGCKCVCLNLVTKIETSLLEDVVIDEHYSCQKPIETIIYDENMELYQVGELMTIWELPQIHRDVRRYLE